MARPGFNRADWDQLKLEEAMLLSFIGKLKRPDPSLEEFQQHFDWYRDIICVFEEWEPSELARRRSLLDDWTGVRKQLDVLNEKTHVLDDPIWSADTDERPLRLQLNSDRVRVELGFLSDHCIDVLVSLTEQVPDPLVQQSSLETHHLPVGDTTPPNRAQVEALAKVLENARADGKKLAVHCLAGIGRTSTMLMAAHLVQGGSLEHVASQLTVRNPRYTFAGGQWAFLQELAADIASSG
ncbi:MAG: hypothetical protein GY725_22725 [bacterium]|nr:hypothetical protein [bacterium]